MTNAIDQGLYGEFLTPGENRPYHVYDKDTKQILTVLGSEGGAFHGAETNEDGGYELPVATASIEKLGHIKTAETPHFVLFERRASRKRERTDDETDDDDGSIDSEQP